MVQLTPEDFEPWVGRTVRVATIPEPVEVVLARVVRHTIHPGSFREPFSLFFEAAPEVYLIDGAYEFDCGRGGPHSIDINQKQPSPERRLYEAIFN